MAFGPGGKPPMADHLRSTLEIGTAAGLSVDEVEAASEGGAR